MFIYWLTLLISLLFVHINSDVNKPQHISMNVIEHQLNDMIVNNSSNKSDKSLIRVNRRENLITNNRQRRQVYEHEHDDDETMAEEIWGMAKKVAITVFVLVSLCIVCCVIITITICVKCCCSGNNNRKRDQGFTTVPQPIIIHTSSPNYPPIQYHQQQAPSVSTLPTQTWQLENHPMLPSPSAPPQPNDDYHMEHPPPYEKIYAH